MSVKDQFVLFPRESGPKEAEGVYESEVQENRILSDGTYMVANEAGVESSGQGSCQEAKGGVFRSQMPAIFWWITAR